MFVDAVSALEIMLLEQESQQIGSIMGAIRSLNVTFMTIVEAMSLILYDYMLNGVL